MGKRKHDDRTLEIKYKALVELEKGNKTNKDVANLFDVPPNTLSTWKKNKDKIFEAFKNQNAGKSKRLKENTYEKLNQAVLKWFTRIRSENVPVSGILIKEKALYFAKELKVEKFQASEGWLDKWKKRLVCFFLYFLYPL